MGMSQSLWIAAERVSRRHFNRLNAPAVLEFTPLTSLRTVPARKIQPLSRASVPLGRPLSWAEMRAVQQIMAVHGLSFKDARAVYHARALHRPLSGWRSKELNRIASEASEGAGGVLTLESENRRCNRLQCAGMGTLVGREMQ